MSADTSFSRSSNFSISCLKTETNGIHATVSNSISPKAGQYEDDLEFGPEPEILSDLEFPLPTFENVVTSYYRIRDGIVRTECTLSQAISKLVGCQVYFKHEYRQHTGSFKERGARNAILLLSEEQRKQGIVAASAGNHALGLAYHGKELGVPVTVVMPTTAPLTKVSRCKELGARVIQAGLDITEAKAFADTEFVQKEGLQYINGFDHPHIVAGQGTIGLEILEQVPDVDAVVLPVGGAGLIAGVALAIKTLKPNVLILGAEPERCASFSAALEAGRPVHVTMDGPTLADGLAVPCVGPHAFEVAKNRVDRIVKVAERAIGLAVLRLVELEKLVQEGAGAGALAALLAGQFPELKGKKVVVLLCGANIDLTVLGRVIERGLAADHRLVRFSVLVMDRPGSISALCKVVSDCGGSIKDIVHERAWLVDDVAHVQVYMVVETTSREHVELLQRRLEDEISRKSPITSWGMHRLLADAT